MSSIAILSNKGLKYEKQYYLFISEESKGHRQWYMYSIDPVNRVLISHGGQKIINIDDIKDANDLMYNHAGNLQDFYLDSLYKALPNWEAFISYIDKLKVNKEYAKNAYDHKYLLKDQSEDDEMRLKVLKNEVELTRNGEKLLLPFVTLDKHSEAQMYSDDLVSQKHLIKEGDEFVGCINAYHHFRHFSSGTEVILSIGGRKKVEDSIEELPKINFEIKGLDFYSKYSGKNINANIDTKKLEFDNTLRALLMNIINS